MIINIITEQKIKYNYSTELKVFRSVGGCDQRT